MNAMTETSDATPHDRVQELLPWYVNQTLENQEENFVREHLQQCKQCRDDAAFAQVLSDAEPIFSETLLPDVDRAYGDINRKLDAMQKRKKLRTYFLRLLRPPQLRFSLISWTLAVQFAAIICLIFLFSDKQENTSIYRVLGSPRIDSGNIVVVFKAGTTVGDMQKILRANEASVVSGPTVTDAYILAVPKEKIVATIVRLRAERSIVLVESLVSGGSN